MVKENQVIGQKQARQTRAGHKIAKQNKDTRKKNKHNQDSQSKTSNQSYYFPSINNSFDKEIEKILKTMLKHIAFDGWPSVDASSNNHPTITNTASSLGLDPSYIKSIFHFATELDFIQAMNKYVDKIMIENYQASKSMSITDKVYFATKARLDFEMQHKICFEKSLFYLSNPINYKFTIKMATRTASIIWQTIGIKDGSDTNSSRAISLSLVLISTWIYWLGGNFDKAEESQKVLAFLRRRLDDVVAFGKLKSKFTQSVNPSANKKTKGSKINNLDADDFKVRYLYNKSNKSDFFSILTKLTNKYTKK